MSTSPDQEPEGAPWADGLEHPQQGEVPLPGDVPPPDEVPPSPS